MVKLVMVVLACIVGVTGMVRELPAASADSGVEAEVKRDLESILDLWRDGRYADLYEQVIPGGKQSKETFVRKMQIATRRPTCCWDKVQEVRVTVKNQTTATVRAKLGFEEGVGTEYLTRTFKVVKQGDVWRLSQADITSLAASSKRKRYWHKNRSDHGENTR
ncbi:hypothetical protein [Geobacter sp. AOG1]|uniref:hypothetical protein n=1 Tax=Geobacter sp. AOG1 TaxID=1566346 RepID=UPI001CC4C1BB|nr:hypothetical protein [Geobacter sp. AOG1]GFE56571.1 hypothetical protein AOG1_04500 [Geobacter sp. AOG1]